jgi:hypothetical protein
MPILYEFDKSSRVWHVKAFGTLTDSDLSAFGAAFFSDPRIDSPYRMLVDCLGITSIEVSWPAIEWFLGLENGPGGREKLRDATIAIVIKDGLGWILAKSFEQKAKGNVMAFFSLDSAISYLHHKR